MSLPVLIPYLCPDCLYRQDGMRDGGWCYMFRELPEGDTCAQFVQRDYPEFAYLKKPSAPLPSAPAAAQQGGRS